METILLCLNSLRIFELIRLLCLNHYLRQQFVGYPVVHLHRYQKLVLRYGTVFHFSHLCILRMKMLENLIKFNTVETYTCFSTISC